MMIQIMVLMDLSSMLLRILQFLYEVVLEMECSREEELLLYRQGQFLGMDRYVERRGLASV